MAFSHHLTSFTHSVFPASHMRAILFNCIRSSIFNPFSYFNFGCDWKNSTVNKFSDVRTSLMQYMNAGSSCPASVKPSDSIIWSAGASLRISMFTRLERLVSRSLLVWQFLLLVFLLYSYQLYNRN